MQYKVSVINTIRRNIGKECTKENNRRNGKSMFLGTVNKKDNDDKWTVQMKIEQTPLYFKIDTGADAFVMGEETLLWRKKASLKRVKRVAIYICTFLVLGETRNTINDSRKY